MLLSSLERTDGFAGRPQPRLVCLDLQREYVVPGRPLYADGAGRVADICAAVLQHARTHHWRIIHARRQKTEGPVDRADYFSAPIEGLRPLISEPVFARSGLSAFCNPDFAAEMRDAQGEEVFIMGFSLNETCLATVFAAADMGLNVTILTDATGAAGAGAAEARQLREAAERMLSPLARLATSHEVMEGDPALGAWS
ncbi:MAG TPA: isochorismatase family protein [Caulobacteraceae bacterium]